jgi:hypothetical protein
VSTSLARSRAAKKRRYNLYPGVNQTCHTGKEPEEEAAERVLNTAAHLHQVTQDLPPTVLLRI